MKIESAVAAAGAGSIITGTVLGLPIAALFAGFWGGFVALSLLAPGKLPTSWVARIGSLVAAIATAGFMGPYAAALAHIHYVDPMLEIFAFSFLWGAGVQVLLPKALAAMGRRIDQAGGRVQ